MHSTYFKATEWHN